ncbi:hypothetical protein GCK72_025029 [Caenorhabditis remanei]|uniref:Uncharacterized protein n=1 Tax=Caenorhabditis remanei TaxID=31234 RepID=A0A6A5G1L8_CAERE|nr:hypothetical protein GCK72_025029 [Caenorhabditis remanei]KAF1748562.1 hypothetical protein GCK72_025029 [Caenorhabditis remanei]
MTKSDGTSNNGEIIPKLEAMSPVPSHPLPIPTNVKPEYSLVSVRSNVPIIHLIYEQPAPPGWRYDLAWHKNVYFFNEPIYYRDNYYHIIHNV